MYYLLMHIVSFSLKISRKYCLESKTTYYTLCIFNYVFYTMKTNVLVNQNNVFYTKLKHVFFTIFLIFMYFLLGKIGSAFYTNLESGIQCILH